MTAIVIHPCAALRASMPGIGTPSFTFTIPIIAATAFAIYLRAGS